MSGVGIIRKSFDGIARRPGHRAVQIEFGDLAFAENPDREHGDFPVQARDTDAVIRLDGAHKPREERAFVARLYRVRAVLPRVGRIRFRRLPAMGNETVARQNVRRTGDVGVLREDSGREDGDDNVRGAGRLLPRTDRVHARRQRLIGPLVREDRIVGRGRVACGRKRPRRAGKHGGGFSGNPVRGERRQTGAAVFQRVRQKGLRVVLGECAAGK